MVIKVQVEQSAIHIEQYSINRIPVKHGMSCVVAICPTNGSEYIPNENMFLDVSYLLCIISFW